MTEKEEDPNSSTLTARPNDSSAEAGQDNNSGTVLTNTNADGFTNIGDVNLNNVSESASGSRNGNPDDVIPTAIVIKNIPFAIKKEQLLDYISNMNLPLPYAFNYHFDNGVFRGLAFANFTTVSETTQVVETLNGKELGGRKLRVEYKKLLPQHERERIEREKREKRGQLEEQHRNISNLSLSSMTSATPTPQMNLALNSAGSTNNSNGPNNASQATMNFITGQLNATNINSVSNINSSSSNNMNNNNPNFQNLQPLTAQNTSNSITSSTMANPTSSTALFGGSTSALHPYGLNSSAINSYNSMAQNSSVSNAGVVNKTGGNNGQNKNSSNSVYGSYHGSSVHNSNSNKKSQMIQRFYAPVPSSSNLPLPPQQIDFNDPDVLEIYSQLLLFKDRNSQYMELCYQQSGLSATHKRYINVLCMFLGLYEVYDPSFLIIRRSSNGNATNKTTSTSEFNAVSQNNMNNNGTSGYNQNSQGTMQNANSASATSIYNQSFMMMQPSLQPMSTGGSINKSHSYTSLLQAHHHASESAKLESSNNASVAGNPQDNTSPPQMYQQTVPSSMRPQSSNLLQNGRIPSSASQLGANTNVQNLTVNAQTNLTNTQIQTPNVITSSQGFNSSTLLSNPLLRNQGVSPPILNAIPATPSLVSRTPFQSAAAAAASSSTPTTPNIGSNAGNNNNVTSNMGQGNLQMPSQLMPQSTSGSIHSTYSAHSGFHDTFGGMNPGTSLSGQSYSQMSHYPQQQQQQQQHKHQTYHHLQQSQQQQQTQSPYSSMSMLNLLQQQKSPPVSSSQPASALNGVDPNGFYSSAGMSLSSSVQLQLNLNEQNQQNEKGADEALKSTLGNQEEVAGAEEDNEHLDFDISKNLTGLEL
ncbi:hypothetical protein ACO0QE_004272 [Hanseniaspora vineae]